MTKDDSLQGDFKEHKLFKQAERYCTEKGTEDLEGWLQYSELQLTAVKTCLPVVQFG